MLFPGACVDVAPPEVEVTDVMFPLLATLPLPHRLGPPNPCTLLLPPHSRVQAGSLTCLRVTLVVDPREGPAYLLVATLRVDLTRQDLRKMKGRYTPAACPLWAPLPTAMGPSPIHMTQGHLPHLLSELGPLEGLGHCLQARWLTLMSKKP